MNLIIRAELVNPPTILSSFRDLTLYSKKFLNLDVLLEIEQEYTDIYYKYLQPRGGLDFVDQFIKPDEERGIFINHRIKKSGAILVEKITPENFLGLVTEIGLRCRVR